jgi:hypothetical protein
MTRPVFGVDRDPANVQGARSKSGTLKFNPLRVAYGPGPEGTRCGTCIHLTAKAYARTYLKCALRTNTNSPSTDHRARWESCAKYESGR